MTRLYVIQFTLFVNFALNLSKNLSKQNMEFPGLEIQCKMAKRKSAARFVLPQ